MIALYISHKTSGQTDSKSEIIHSEAERADIEKSVLAAGMSITPDCIHIHTKNESQTNRFFFTDREKTLLSLRILKE